MEHDQKPNPREVMDRYWYVRLSQSGKDRYHKAALLWCGEHKRYLNECGHFREWLIEDDKESR